MMFRRSLGILAGVAMLAGGLSPAAADRHPFDHYPIIERPVLTPDTAWVETEWGYHHEDLSFPDGSGWRYPVRFRMEGYDGASRPAPNAYLRVDDGTLIALLIEFDHGFESKYVRIHASTRGTECSGGRFFLYDRRHAWDGHEIIEWAGAQPWSNGRVGMEGSSFPGQTAYWVASTQPPSLKAISANLLHSDIYRDIFMPGGIQNYLFPVIWYLSGPNRLPTTSVNRGTIPEDEICSQHQAQRTGMFDLPNPHRDYIWLAAEGTDNDFYQAHRAASYAHLINIPMHMKHNWHDEQTGPRAVVLWNYVNPDPVEIVDSEGNLRTVVPKAWTLSNGSHGYGGMADRDLWDWFNMWLLDETPTDHTGFFDGRATNYFEIRGNGTYTAKVEADEWPFPQSEWTRLYLGSDASLGDAAPAESGSDVYVSGVKTRNWQWLGGRQAIVPEVTTASDLPDAAVYQTEALTEDTVIAGPILAELYASLELTDTDFFVSVHEVWPDGTMSYLQRGLLKASHRAVNPLRSWYNADGELIQPWRPHTNPIPVVPGKIERYDIEVWPLGHIFRAGNRIRIQIHTPPAFDNIWGYTAHQHQPGLVNIHWGGETPSNIFLPVIPAAELQAGTAAPVTDCWMPGGFACAQVSDL